MPEIEQPAPVGTVYGLCIGYMIYSCNNSFDSSRLDGWQWVTLPDGYEGHMCPACLEKHRNSPAMNVVDYHLWQMQRLDSELYTKLMANWTFAWHFNEIINLAKKGVKSDQKAD